MNNVAAAQYLVEYGLNEREVFDSEDEAMALVDRLVRAGGCVDGIDVWGPEGLIF